MRSAIFYGHVEACDRAKMGHEKCVLLIQSSGFADVALFLPTGADVTPIVEAFNKVMDGLQEKKGVPVDEGS